MTPTVAAAGTTTNTVPAAAHLQIDVAGQDGRPSRAGRRGDAALRPTLPGARASRCIGGPNRPPMEPTSGAALFERARLLGLRDGLG